MKTLERIQTLSAAVKKPGQGLDDLGRLLEDYQNMLNDVIHSNEAYRVSLRRQREELPDLQRLIGKKHDAILKGRLLDGITAVKKAVENVEKPVAEEATCESLGADETVVSLQDEERRPTRNMPTLGMD